MENAETRAVHHRPSARYRSNQSTGSSDRAIDRARQKSKFFHFVFSAFFQLPSVIQSCNFDARQNLSSPSSPPRSWLKRSHSGRRSIRSIGRSRDRIDRFDRFDNFSDFLPRRGARDLSAVKVSALYDAWRPKKRRNNKIPKRKKWIFCCVRFDRFDNQFDSIDNVPMGDGGPPYIWPP